MPERFGAGLAWVAVSAFGVLVVLRDQEPLPRWDLLACMAVAGVGLLLWLRPRSTGAATRSASPGGRTPGYVPSYPGAPGQPPARPGTPPPGFRPDGRWRLENRSLRLSLVLFAVLVPLVLLSILSTAKTAQQEEIKRAGATSSQIQVTSAKPLGAGGRGQGLRWEVTGTTEHKGESRTLRGELDSYGQIRPGTELWAMYAPDDPKAGVILSTTESALTSKGDGPLQQLTFVLLSLVVLVLTIVRATVYGVRARVSTESAVANSVYAGSALVLRVRITGLVTSRTQRAAALRLTAVEGDRELLLGPWVDVDLLADELEGREAWMYWKQSPESGGPWDHLRSGAGARSRLPCVLVLDDGTYLKGHTPAVHDDSTPPGYAIGHVNVPSAPVVRPVQTALLRRPRVRPLRLLCYGLAVALVTATLFLPAGEYADFEGAGLTLAAALTVLLLAGQQAGRSTGLSRRAAARRDPAPTAPHRAA